MKILALIPAWLILSQCKHPTFLENENLLSGSKTACIAAAGELETALKRAESHSWSDSASVDKAVSDAVKEVSRTVKITKGDRAASRGDSVLGKR
jgi:hypothetical protein